MRSCPPSGTDRPAISESKVVLPAPAGPRRVRTSPSATSRSVGASAVIDPERGFRPAIASFACAIGRLLQDPGFESLGDGGLVLEPVLRIDLHAVLDVVGVRGAVLRDVGLDVLECVGLRNARRE